MNLLHPLSAHQSTHSSLYITLIDYISLNSLPFSFSFPYPIYTRPRPMQQPQDQDPTLHPIAILGVSHSLLAHFTGLTLSPSLSPATLSISYILHLIVDELRSEDVTLRLNAIHRVSTISLALGPERTRDELLPFLQESLDDDDEILLALAEELGQNFVEYVGGQPFAHVILGPLEHLAAMEETLVREKASESITIVCASLSEAQVEEFYLPLLKRLSTGEWFTSRTSATALFAAAYGKASQSTKDEMRRMFSALCTDDTPMVRRAAAKELGPFSKKLAHDVLLSDLVPSFKKLAMDDQDSVRLLTVDALIDIAEALNDDECKSYLGQTMKALVGDKSWRVRYMVADHFVKLAEAAGPDIVRDELVVAFVALLKDNEAEVRTAATGQIPGSFVFHLFLSHPFRATTPTKLTVSSMSSFPRIRQAPRSRGHPPPTLALRQRSLNRSISTRQSCVRNSNCGIGTTTGKGFHNRTFATIVFTTFKR